MQMPNTGTRPNSSRTVAGTVATAAGSPGPFDRNTPSGARPRMSAAVADAGTTSTVPMAARCRTIVLLIPRSMATMRRPAPVVDATTVVPDDVTVATMSRPSVPVARCAALRRVASSAVPNTPGSAPWSRRCRVRRRVSTPAIPGMPWARR
jgi:hypothetical protein